MIKIIEHQRETTGDEILIRDNTQLKPRVTPFYGTRGRIFDYFHTRRDEHGPIVTVHLYGDGPEFDLEDRDGRYNEIDLPTVQLNSPTKDWSDSTFGIWLPDRKLWVGIEREIAYSYKATRLTLSAPFEVDTHLAAAIYEALHGRRFEHDVAKLDPATIKPRD